MEPAQASQPSSSASPPAVFSLWASSQNAGNNDVPNSSGSPEPAAPGTSLFSSMQFSSIPPSASLTSIRQTKNSQSMTISSTQFLPFGNPPFWASSAMTAASSSSSSIFSLQEEVPSMASALFMPKIKPVEDTSQSESFQHISSMDIYKKWSAEEIRLENYKQIGSSGPQVAQHTQPVQPGIFHFSPQISIEPGQARTISNTNTASLSTSVFGQQESSAFKTTNPDCFVFQASPNVTTIQPVCQPARQPSASKSTTRSGLALISNNDPAHFNRSYPPKPPAEDPDMDAIDQAVRKLDFNRSENEDFAQLPPDPHSAQSKSNISTKSPVGAITNGPTVEKALYNIDEEDYPTHPLFTPRFQNALKDGQGIAKAIETLSLDLSEVVDDNLHASLNKLQKDAKDLSTFHGVETRTIAVLGDSGGGKSSLINSLLHYPDLAKTGDIGSACTSVVTEYRQKRTEHGNSPITFEVEFLTQPEIENMVQELLWSYRQLFLPGVESDTTTEADYARYVRESELAWSALEAAFKHRPEFKQEMLQDMSDGALERLQESIVNWTKDMEWPSGSGVGEKTPGFWTETAQSAEECSAKTELFAQDRYWPFTKIIRIYLDSKVLETGLILADLPGLQDSNLARVKAAQNYLMRCSNVFIVTNISRAITDQSLKSSIYHILSKHAPLEWEQSGGKGFNLAVVCTRSEDIDLKKARSEFVGEDKRIQPRLMDELDESINVSKKMSDYTRTKNLKRQQQWHLIKARNAHVSEGLQRVYASRVPDQALQVFCVSNTTYSKYCRKGNTTLVEHSGIPALRMFCYSIMMEVQYQEAKSFLDSKLANLLISMDLLVKGCMSTESQENNVEWSPLLHETLSKDLEKSHKRLHGKVAALCADFKESFEEQISTLTDGRHEYWVEAAAKEGQEWYKWHWTQYRAFCLNNGHHETHKRPREDWNAKIIWKMRTELDYQWDILEEEIPGLFTQLEKAVLKTLRVLRAKIEEILENYSFDSFLSLKGTLDAKMRSAKYSLSVARDWFAREVKLIRRHASESNYNSYVLGEMIPAYRSASSESGTGMAARMKATVQGRITDGTLFPNMAITLSHAIHDLLARSEKRLGKIMDDIVAGIKTDLDIAFAMYEKMQRKELRISNELKASTLEIMHHLKERHKGLSKDINLDESGFLEGR